MNANTQTAQWQTLCHLSDLVANSGVAALMDQQQVALFWLPAEQTVFAIDNYDPISDTHLNARGLIGDLQGQPMLATPLYKNHYRLTDGQCLEEDHIRLRTWPVKIEAEQVMILA